MKDKISITLTQELVKDIDERAKLGNQARSEFIETALKAYIDHLSRDEQNMRDLEIINRNAEFLNQEAADVLEYQIPL